MRNPIIQLNKSLDIIKIFEKKDNSKVIHIIKETNTIKFNDLVSTTTYPSLPSNFIKMVFLKLLENKITTRDTIQTYKVSPFELRYDIYEKGTRKRTSGKETAQLTKKNIRNNLKKTSETRKKFTTPEDTTKVSKSVSYNGNTDPTSLAK
jgi:hypothetical protein